MISVPIVNTTGTDFLRLFIHLGKKSFFRFLLFSFMRFRSIPEKYMKMGGAGTGEGLSAVLD